MDDSIEFEFKLRIASSIADGVSYKQLMALYGLNYSQLRRYKEDASFQQLVTEIVEDNRTSAYYRLISSSRKAVDELISYLGNGELSDREQFAAINLILSLTMEADKKSRTTAAVTQVKGYTRKNAQDIREAILGKRPPS